MCSFALSDSFSPFSSFSLLPIFLFPSIENLKLSIQFFFVFTIGGYHSNFLLVFLGEIHSRANQIFSTFMEAEVNHINHFKKAIKRSGVIPCVEFTPLFAQYAEGLVAASSSNASELSPMDISYLKIFSAVRESVPEFLYLFYCIILFHFLFLITITMVIMIITIILIVFFRLLL